MEGADLVTGSTHKTFFGTQRGVVGSRFQEHEERYELWEALERRAFPGSVSNHHLGTLLGLLMAAYEMNHFKGEYQARVVKNAKAFARALSDSGMNVAGDPAYSTPRKELAAKLMHVLRRNDDPRVVETPCRFEHEPYAGSLLH